MMQPVHGLCSWTTLWSTSSAARGSRLRGEPGCCASVVCAGTAPAMQEDIRMTLAASVGRAPAGVNMAAPLHSNGTGPSSWTLLLSNAVFLCRG